MDTIIDQAWASLLATVMKKRDILRPEIGDEIDLYVPQSRLLSLSGSNSGVPGLLYPAAWSSAERNARNIMKRLGMPADYFWKFEYWPRTRALTNLGQIVKRVFSSMMAQAKEGNLEIAELAVDPLRITVDFNGCAECAGIGALGHAICYYHAGIFAGILSGLISRTLDGIETECLVLGNNSCRYTVGDREDEHIKTEHAAYLAPRETRADLISRLEKSLHRQPVRALGNMVDINYLRLVMVTALLASPERLASTNFEVGSQLGRNLAPVLTEFYGQPGLQSLREYYSQLGELKVEVKGDEVQLELMITECAEAVGPTKTEMLSFLLGEIQGLASELTKTEKNVKECRFEGEKLLVTLVPKE